MEEHTMKNLFITAITAIAIALSVPAFAATNGGVSTWLQVQNNDFVSAYNDYQVGTWDMYLQDMSGVDLVAFGPGASAQAARDVSFANVPGVTIVDSGYQGVASAPSRRSFAGLWAGSGTDISVPGVDAQLTRQMNLTATNGGVASGQGGSSIVFIKNN